MRSTSFLVPTALALTLAACQQAQTEAQPKAEAVADKPAGMSDAELIKQGEYLARIAGCNDCHTPGYAESAG